MGEQDVWNTNWVGTPANVCRAFQLLASQPSTQRLALHSLRSSSTCGRASHRLQSLILLIGSKPVSLLHIQAVTSGRSYLVDVRTEPVYRSLLGSLFSDQFGLKFLLNEIVSMIYVSGIVLENFARNAKLKKKRKESLYIFLRYSGSLHKIWEGCSKWESPLPRICIWLANFKVRKGKGGWIISWTLIKYDSGSAVAFRTRRCNAPLC